MQTYSLHPDQLAIMADGEAALNRIDQHESFHDWLKVGKSVTMWREIAMEKAGTDDINAHAYRVAHKAAVEDFPKLAKLNKTERSHAVWLWDNHDGLEAWHRTLPPNQARAFNHPSTIWRKNPLGEYREKKPRTSRTEAADIIKDAAAELREAKDQLDVATAVNPGLDLSTPEMIDASGRTLVDYYGVRPVAALLRAVAPLVDAKVQSYDLSDTHYGASAQDFIAHYVPEYGEVAIARFADALKALVTRPEAPLDPAFAASVKKPRRRRQDPPAPSPPTEEQFAKLRATLLGLPPEAKAKALRRRSSRKILS
jgi:hypothetical protein